MTQLRYLLVSVCLHGMIIGMSWLVARPFLLDNPNSSTILFETQIGEGTLSSLDYKVQKRWSKSKPQTKLATPSKGNPIDLRPSFAKNGLFFIGDEKAGANRITDEGDGKEFGGTKDFLFTESKVYQVFDLLAERIDLKLEYPVILAENGIQGNAVLDLYFDSHGKIDEQRSKVLGSHRVVRGLLVRASRSGIVDWMIHDASRIRKDQFKNQHFKALFEISHTTPGENSMLKTAVGHYQFLRRHNFAFNCISGKRIVAGDQVLMSGSMELMCLGTKISGAVKRYFSGDYRSRYIIIVDQLEDSDQLGLDGLNAAIQQQS